MKISEMEKRCEAYIKSLTHPDSDEEREERGDKCAWSQADVGKLLSWAELPAAPGGSDGEEADDGK